MTNSWKRYIGEINTHIDKIGLPYFRGHADSQWKLLPVILREVDGKFTEIGERTLYYDFIASAGSLIKVPNKSWDLLYTMQHHGFPTRLLDWTETFAIALYFAIESSKIKQPEIWVLDPYQLCYEDNSGLLNPEEDISFNYYDGFISQSSKNLVFKNPIAIYPNRKNDRLFKQKGTFTIHGIKNEPIEDLCPNAVKRFPIPLDAIDDARNFLKLAGINEFSIYSDLDSLARHFKKIHNY